MEGAVSDVVFLVKILRSRNV